MRVYSSMALVVYVVALLHHNAQVGFVDLPADGASALRRAVEIASLQALPWRGNSIGTHYWFGIADDYLLAPFLVGAGSLESVLRRGALFFALIAPLCFAIGAALRRPLLGLAFGLAIAGLPDVVALSSSYPLNYRTTHWALLTVLGAVLAASPMTDTKQRQAGTSLLLIGASLASASHPFGAAALLPAFLICGVTGVWPRGKLLKLSLAASGLCLVPYVIANAPGLWHSLFERGSDTRAGTSWVLAGGLDALRNLSKALDGLAGGPSSGLLLLAGIPFSLRSTQGRAVFSLCLTWIVLAAAIFVLAGYPPKTWHLRPGLYLLLALGFIGWCAVLPTGAQLAPWPATGHRTKLSKQALISAAGAVITLTFLLLQPPAIGTAATAPVRGFSQLSEAILDLAQGREFQYLEGQAHCPLNWSAEATLLDLQLRSGDFRLGSDTKAPVLAALQRIDSFERHPLATAEHELQLSNGLFFRLHWNPYPQAFRDQLRKYCPAQAEGARNEPFFLGGPGLGDLDNPCFAEGVCNPTLLMTGTEP